MTIGLPGEDVGAVVDAGSAQILRIGKSNISAPYPSLTEDSPGTPGVVQTGSRFGSTVTGLPGDRRLPPPQPAVSYGEAVFAISSPFQGGGSVYVVSDDRSHRAAFLEARHRWHQWHRRAVRPVRRLTGNGSSRARSLLKVSVLRQDPATEH